MGYKILCVDDSKSVHSFLKSCVDGDTEKFVSAYDGQEAIDLLQKERPDLDLIFLDWEMPRKTGPETMIEISRLGVQTPVIMLTAKNSPENILQMLDLGVAEYIMKPFTKDIILDKINSVLERGKI